MRKKKKPRMTDKRESNKTKKKTHLRECIEHICSNYTLGYLISALDIQDTPSGTYRTPGLNART